jgi:hypothetical protein
LEKDAWQYKIQRSKHQVGFLYYHCIHVLVVDFNPTFVGDINSLPIILNGKIIVLIFDIFAKLEINQ